MRTRSRRILIAAAGLAAAGLAWFAPPPEGAVVAPASRAARPGAAEGPAAPARFSALPQRGPVGEPAGELFASRSWAPPPKPAPVEAAKPAAPPNPYRFAGTVVEAGAARVYLSRGERVYEARQGDELDGGYRVETIAADRIVLLYVPLGTRDALAAPSSLQVQVPAAPLQPAAASPAASPAPASAGKPAQLRWEGPQQVKAGASFSVALRVSSEEPLRATPMQLRYAPEVLEPLDVRAGKFLATGGFSYRVNPEGAIFVGATGPGVAPGADAELLVVTFRPKKAGTTAEVDVSALALHSAGGRAIAHERPGVFRTAIH